MVDRVVTNYPFGELNEKQKEGLTFITNKLLSSTIQEQKQQAYVLATIKHECADRWQPIKELGTPTYLRSKKYWPFIGRGYVQITWRSNYQKFSRLLNIDILHKPELALRPEISWVITEMGMRDGLFTGKKLSDYLTKEKEDFYNARKIINGLDKAEKIAGIAIKFYEVIRQPHIPKEIKDDLADGRIDDIPEAKPPEKLS